MNKETNDGEFGKIRTKNLVGQIVIKIIAENFSKHTQTYSFSVITLSFEPKHSINHMLFWRSSATVVCSTSEPYESIIHMLWQVPLALAYIVSILRFTLRLINSQGVLRGIARMHVKARQCNGKAIQIDLHTLREYANLLHWRMLCKIFVLVAVAGKRCLIAVNFN